MNTKNPLANAEQPAPSAPAEFDPSARWAEAYIRDGAILICVPMAALPDALEQNPRDDSYADCRVTDLGGFARDVVRELNREAEDGTTPIHLLFDAAMAEAIEQGSEHVGLTESPKGKEE